MGETLRLFLHIMSSLVTLKVSTFFYFVLIFSVVLSFMNLQSFFIPFESAPLPPPPPLPPFSVHFKYEPYP